MKKTPENKIPVVLSFDQNMLVPAGVCMTSLLMNALPDTFYDFIVLYSPADLPENKRKELLKVADVFPNCRLSFFNVGSAFQGAYEVRNITICTYYRLLLPDFMEEINGLHGTDYRTFIYMDVDIVAECDLGMLYNRCCEQQDVWVFGVCESPLYWGTDASYHDSIGCDAENYINAGVLVMNAATMKRHGFTEECLKHRERKYLYQDQDIINIVCKGHVRLLPLKYNFTWSLYRSIEEPRFRDMKKEEIEEASSGCVIHYTGEKPWKALCFRFETWWHYYEKSAFADATTPIALYNSIPEKVISSPPLQKMLRKVFLSRLGKNLFRKKKNR